MEAYGSSPDSCAFNSSLIFKTDLRGMGRLHFLHAGAHSMQTGARPLSVPRLADIATNQSGTEEPSSMANLKMCRAMGRPAAPHLTHTLSGISRCMKSCFSPSEIFRRVASSMPVSQSYWSALFLLPFSFRVSSSYQLGFNLVNAYVSFSNRASGSSS